MQDEDSETSETGPTCCLCRDVSASLQQNPISRISYIHVSHTLQLTTKQHVSNIPITTTNTEEDTMQEEASDNNKEIHDNSNQNSDNKKEEEDKDKEKKEKEQKEEEAIQLLDLFRHLDYEGGVHISTCNHYMHNSCFQRYKINIIY